MLEIGKITSEMTLLAERILKCVPLLTAHSMLMLIIVVIFYDNQIDSWNQGRTTVT